MSAGVDLENLDSIVQWKPFGSMMLWVEVKVRGQFLKVFTSVISQTF